MEVVASLSQGRTAAAQCGLFTYKSVPVIFEPPFIYPSLDYGSHLSVSCVPFFHFLMISIHVLHPQSELPSTV